MRRLNDLLVADDASVGGVIAAIEKGGHGIALVVDEDRRLLGTVTDGDVRRATLAGVKLTDSVASILKCKPQDYRNPITARPEVSRIELMHLMNSQSLHHVPIVDEFGVVCDIAVLSELMKEFELPLSAVIMAGGFGTRLRPLTDNLPKPMLEVGEKPVLEMTVRQLERAGIRRINVISHYRSDAIVRHFGNGGDFGVTIEHVREDQPMGTAGGLGLISAPAQPLLVMNGDIVTRLNYSELYRFHCDKKSQLTVGVRAHDVQIPFGVIERSESTITSIVEKPTYTYFVNAGIYLLDPEVFNHLPKVQKFDMTDVISVAISQGLRVVPFEIKDYWLDIGSLKDYEQAQKDAAGVEGA